MKLFDWVKSKILNIPLFQTGTWNNIRSFFTGNKNSADYYRGWVFTAVTAIAEEVSEIKLHLTRLNDSGEKEIHDDHPAQKLLKSVNGFFTRKTLFERLQSNLELRGNEYWLIEKDKKGVPIGIYPLNPDCVVPLSDPYDYIAGYEYTLGSEKFKIPKDFIIHFKTFNPKSDICGISTLEAARVTVDSDEASKEYNRVFYQNNAAPGVVLKYPTRLDQDKIKEMKEQWDSEFQGFKKGYRTAVMSGGLDIETVNVSHSDMEYLENRKANRDEILAIFRVPKMAAGVTEELNFASAKAAIYVFSRFTIKPKMTRITDTLNEFYLSLFTDTDNMTFEYESPIQDDVTEKIAYYTAGVNNGWLTLNDVRRFENLIELENGDDVFLPFSLQPYTKPKAKAVQEKPLQKRISSVVKSVISAINPTPKEEPKKKALRKV